MNNVLLTIFVLALLLVTIFSPFSALALLMVVLFVAAFATLGWTLLKTLLFGEPHKN